MSWRRCAVEASHAQSDAENAVYADFVQYAEETVAERDEHIGSPDAVIQVNELKTVKQARELRWLQAPELFRSLT